MAPAPNPTCHSAICARDWLQPSRIIIIANLPREDAALQLSVLLQFSKGCNHLQVSSDCHCERAALQKHARHFDRLLCFPSHSNDTVKFPAIALLITRMFWYFLILEFGVRFLFWFETSQSDQHLRKRNRTHFSNGMHKRQLSTSVWEYLCTSARNQSAQQRFF